MNKRHATLSGFCAAALLFSNQLIADWQLNNDASSLHFISVKKGDIAETHHFKALSGSITDEGKASLAIDLASVNTKIPIRDQRMQEFLFETKAFTTANVSLDLGKDGVKAGVQSLTATLDLHGVKKEVKADVVVTEAGDQVQVTTVAPIVVNAPDFSLDAGVEKLRELAQLDVISKAVPVTFNLVFDKAGEKAKAEDKATDEKAPEAKTK